MSIINLDENGINLRVVDKVRYEYQQRCLELRAPQRWQRVIIAADLCNAYAMSWRHDHDRNERLVYVFDDNSSITISQLLETSK